MSSQSVKTFKYANIRGFEDDPYKLKRPNVSVLLIYEATLLIIVALYSKISYLDDGG